ncbi:hypothetical protein Acr_26g0002480 [Actinidia rufa]|uniref:Uncharacterized protein n=1 Tax=Actinidia rufa TaxID=165716 RepID=A0A7J0H1U7_9ERIC|nr:hypothetical protein Acr_26g0002480 [Actinidia rufa]
MLRAREACCLPRGKRNPPKAKASSSKVKTTVATGAGTSANLVTILGAYASILKNYDVAKKFIEGVIPPLKKAAANKLEFDQVILRLFQGIGEMWDDAMIQQGRATSMESEMTRAQKTALDLERQLAKVKIREQRTVDELKKTKEDRDATVARLETEVAELKKGKALANKKAIEEFKSLDDF